MTPSNKYLKILLMLVSLVMLTLGSLPAAADSFPLWNGMVSASTNALSCLWGADSSHVFAAGNAGVIQQYNGSTWSVMSSGVSVNLNGIWGSGSGDIYAVGASGTILHYDGSAWSAMSSGVTLALNGVWGSGSNDVYAVGASGTLLHYDGSVWKAQSSGVTLALNGVWGSGSGDIYAVGASGTMLHYDGSTWKAQSSGVTLTLNSVWGSGSSDIYAVGASGTVLHYDGSAWKALSSGLGVNLNGVWVADADDVFMVGEVGTVVYYHGAEFSVMNRNTINTLRAVYGFSAIDAFAAGDSGIILRYLPPLILSVSPAQGNQGETLDVVINGKNLGATSAVGFGAGISVNSFTVNSAARVTASITVVPGAQIGARDVQLTTPSGSFTLAGSFKVNQALPTITALSPAVGNQSATLDITISGINFSGASSLLFGTGISVNRFTVINSSQITANISIAVDATTGTRDVQVTTPGGSFTLPAGFNVIQALPAVGSIKPAQDNQGVTLDVIIIGSNLNGTSQLRFGAGITINTYTVINSSQITANISIAPDAAVGVRDVTLTTPGGSAVVQGGFTVKQALPTITAVSPAQGNQGTTIDVTIAGTYFSGASELRFGNGITVNGFSILSANQISASISISADAATGSRDVMVTTPGGSYALANGFTLIQALPTISAVTPASGNQGATLNVVISGTNLSNASEVRLGTGIAVNSFTVINSNRISASITIIAGTEAGTRDVSVTTPGGKAVMSNSFSVNQALPVITSITPAKGIRGDTLTIIISGSNLGGATSVNFGAGTLVQSFSNLSPTQLSVIVAIDDAAVTGLRDVSVTTPGGSSTLTNRFEITQGALGVLGIALIWLGVGAIVVLFAVVLNALRKNRRAGL